MVVVNDKCPICGNKECDATQTSDGNELRCLNCGYKWKIKNGY